MSQSIEHSSSSVSSSLSVYVCGVFGVVLFVFWTVCLLHGYCSQCSILASKY